MARLAGSGFANALRDSFVDVWKLLSETTTFLAKTRVFDQYEAQLREWRSALQSAPRNGDVLQRVRREIVVLRKQLRSQGYDLSLGSRRLSFEGFRNDASLGEGFRRLVVFLGEDGVYWLAGDDNHITLGEFLEERLDRMKVRSSGERHYLWYLRRGGELVLSGSDSESKEDFARLERIGNANPLLLLSALKGLR